MVKNAASIESHSSSLQSHSSGRPPALCIAVIGATGDLARWKIFPALFALYYSGFLPEVQVYKPLLIFDVCIYVFFEIGAISKSLDMTISPSFVCNTTLNDIFFPFLGLSIHQGNAIVSCLCIGGLDINSKRDHPLIFLSDLTARNDFVISVIENFF